MPKYVKFFNQVERFVNTVDTTNLKKKIGDSVRNNRVPTVRQVIRYLKRPGATRIQKVLGNNINFTYDILKDDIAAFRTLLNNRTDGFDINEFIRTYDAMVINGENPELKRLLGRNLTV